MVPMLQQLGMRHVGYGLKADYFETAGTVLLDVLAERLDLNWHRMERNCGTEGLLMQDIPVFGFICFL